jgi:HD-GYP domain-containing protein (c-di-GMP phosphodiesterase class II)
MKPRREKDPNPLVQVIQLRDRLRRSLLRERHKGKNLTAARLQLLKYARDLKRVVSKVPVKADARVRQPGSGGPQGSQAGVASAQHREGDKDVELTATKAQLLVYANDLKKMLARERKKSDEVKAAHEQMLKYVGDLKESLKISRQQSRELDEAYRATIIALSRAVEARDPYTAFHTDRVTAYALEIAKQLGWAKTKLSILEMGGHIHDLGKLAVLDSILNKPGRLTPEEFVEMRNHPLRGAEIVKGIRFLQPMIPYILYHHERYDGTGYPEGLKGEAIPEEGRLLAVADTFDAMTSSRSYRKALPLEKAIQELRDGAGTQFDPMFVEAFLNVWETGAMASILALGAEGQATSFGRKKLLESDAVLVRA